MALGRKVKIELRTPVTKNGGNSYSWDYTYIEELDLDFNITRTRRFNDNCADLTIYNMSRDTANKYLKYGCTILIYAGYGDEYGGETQLIFSGNVIEARYERNGTDSITKVRALALRSLTQPFTATPIMFNYTETTADVPLKQVAEALGLVTFGLDNVKDIKMYWLYYVGGTGNALEMLGRMLKLYGFNLYIDVSTLFVYRIDGGDLKQSIAYLSYNTGLLRLSDVTDYYTKATGMIDDFSSSEKVEVTTTEVIKKGKNKGKKKKVKVWKLKSDGVDIYKEIENEFIAMPKKFSATTLMMPKLKPNGLVRVRDDDIGLNAYLVIDEMHISGGTYADSPFEMELTLVERVEQDVVEDMEES